MTEPKDCPFCGEPLRGEPVMHADCVSVALREVRTIRTGRGYKCVEKAHIEAIALRAAELWPVAQRLKTIALSGDVCHDDTADTSRGELEVMAESIRDLLLALGLEEPRELPNGWKLIEAGIGR